MDRGTKKGFITERRFRKGMERKREQGLFPSWLSFVTAAEPHEDSQGVDAWAYTDAGKIPIQIKADVVYKLQHEQRHNRQHIPCIVVPLNKPFDEIFVEAVQIIGAEREKILARRAKIDELAGSK